MQEGLTNTLRHARNPNRVEVAIAYAADRIELAVRDDGQPYALSATPAEAGNGLLGMRERVAGRLAADDVRSLEDRQFVHGR